MNTRIMARRLLMRLIDTAIEEAVYITRSPTVHVPGQPQYTTHPSLYSPSQTATKVSYEKSSRLSEDYYVLHEVVGIFARVIHSKLSMGDHYKVYCADSIIRLYRESQVMDPYRIDPLMNSADVCKALAAILEAWVKEITATPMELALAKHRDTILYRLSGICHVFFLGDKKNNDVFHADVFSVLSPCFTQEEKGMWFARATKDRFGLPINVSNYDELDWKKWVFNLPEMILRWELENLEEPAPKNTKKGK